MHLSRPGRWKAPIALLATLSLRLYIQRFLTSSESREPSPDTITGILTPESHPQSLRDLSALHVYRDLHSASGFLKGTHVENNTQDTLYILQNLFFGPLLARFRG